MLDQAVTSLNGVGRQTAEQLQDLGIKTIKDLLEYFPFRYEDYRLRDLADVKHDEKVTLEGKVHSEPVVRYYGKKKSKLTIRVLVDRYLISVVFFNRAYLKNKIEPGAVITVSGKWDQHRMTLAAQEVTFSKIPDSEAIVGVYHLKGKLKMKTLRRYIDQALEGYVSDIGELLPVEVMNTYQLMPRGEAIKAMHAPQSHEQLKQARRRFVYEELLLFQLNMQMLRKINREQTDGEKLIISDETVAGFIESLPFPLTGAQERVVQEILKDLRSPYLMSRLLQGDVGSGKTVVAAIALYATVKAGFQGALMVPTEILAEQHADSMLEMLARHDLTVALLTSSVKGKRREAILTQLVKGEIDVVIGTHALIQDDVQFQRLGLVITDEQHRFGVEQRKVLRQKGLKPNVLFMTATPIPRTLAITTFGDMDVSVINEMPAGRKPIETRWVKHDTLPKVLEFMGRECEKGRQAYVICPLIEESDKLDVQNAIDVHTQLAYHFNDLNVGLMHGRLSSEEKDDVMQQFSTGDVDILVSTTVVEVGVNVPNATMMVIYDAERFGLAQLHQLRGRVGRGEHQSYCILLADPKSDVGKERMRIMTETNDGFELSERDLELRGPGDFFGQKQSGLPDFKVADLAHDYKVLEAARRDANRLVHMKSFWTEARFAPLREHLHEKGALSTEKLD